MHGVPFLSRLGAAASGLQLCSPTRTGSSGGSDPGCVRGTPRTTLPTPLRRPLARPLPAAPCPMDGCRHPDRFIRPDRPPELCSAKRNFLFSPRLTGIRGSEAPTLRAWARGDSGQVLPPRRAALQTLPSCQARSCPALTPCGPGEAPSPPRFLTPHGPPSHRGSRSGFAPRGGPGDGWPGSRGCSAAAAAAALLSPFQTLQPATTRPP